jgi:hypothetical protein
LGVVSSKINARLLSVDTMLRKSAYFEPRG